MKIRILSYNIHKGLDWTNRKYFLHEIKELIKSTNADLVFLQEVCGQNSEFKKDGLIDAQFEFLADSMWRDFAYAKNAVYDQGNHGNAILSKFPITSWENVNICTNRIEKRGLLVCRLEIPQLKRSVYAACLHLNLLQQGRKLQYEMIKNKVLSLDLPADTPLIIAGDFNDWNNKAGGILENELGMREAHKEILGATAKTFPAAFPILNLDRIYIKNLKIVNAGIWPAPAQHHFSDHLPLFCEVEIE